VLGFNGTTEPVLQYLGSVQRFEVADGQLQIFRSDGEALTFVPAK